MIHARSCLPLTTRAATEMNTLRRSHTFPLLLWLAAAPQGMAHAQEVENPEEIVRAYFDGENYAPAMASGTCPGDDALNDAVVEELMRPRSEEETRRLVTAWAYVPPCRADQILDWYDRATRIITGELDARALARRVLRIDETAGLQLLRGAAADPSVPDDARGAYQSAVYFRLSRAEQEDLYIETFRQELQVGRYRNMSLGNLLYGPDAADAAIRLLSEVLEDPHNERAPYVLGTVLGVVTTLGRERFGAADRQRMWDLLEPRLGSLPPEMRSAIESHEADLKGSGDL